ncbi:MAG: valine--tRNA ligase, partial [Clostridiales bacterium]|nr:valine--tRNA ligase [Clostridiales bacterium]
VSAWPALDQPEDPEAEMQMQMVMDAVKAVRGLRHDMNVPTGKRAPVYLVSDDADMRALFEAQKEAFQLLAFASDVAVSADNQLTEQAVSTVSGGIQIFLPLKDLVHLDEEIARMEKEEKRLQGELKRLSGKLSNQGFVTKAPAEVVAQERQKLETYQGDLTTVQERLALLKSL